MEAPGRFELPTRGLGNRCSIHLSYGAAAIPFSHVRVPIQARHPSACSFAFFPSWLVGVESFPRIRLKQKERI